MDEKKLDKNLKTYQFLNGMSGLAVGVGTTLTAWAGYDNHDYVKNLLGVGLIVGGGVLTYFAENYEDKIKQDFESLHNQKKSLENKIHIENN